MKSKCEICGGSMEGNLYHMHGYTPSKEIKEIEKIKIGYGLNDDIKGSLNEVIDKVNELTDTINLLIKDKNANKN